MYNFGGADQIEMIFWPALSNSNEEHAGKAVHAQGVLDILNFELQYFFEWVFARLEGVTLM